MKKLSLCLVLVLALSLMLWGCGNEEETYEKRDLSFGTIEDGVYTNTYLGASVAADGWTLENAYDLGEQLKGLEGMELEGEQLEKHLDRFQSILVFKMTNPENAANVNILYDRLTTAEQRAERKMSDRDIVDRFLKDRDQMIREMESSGMEVESIDAAEVTWLGETCPAVRTLCESYGIPMCILTVTVHNLGNFDVMITATALTEEEAAEALAMFQPLNP